MEVRSLVEECVFPMQEGVGSGEVELIGRKLSIVINCAVRWPELKRTVLVCHCGVIFSITMLRDAYHSNDWSKVTAHHNKNRRL